MLNYSRHLTGKKYSIEKSAIKDKIFQKARIKLQAKMCCNVELENIIVLFNSNKISHIACVLLHAFNIYF